MSKYEINDCGVVVNPDIIWRFMKHGAYSWCYWEIKIGQVKSGLWDFGYNVGGGGSPVSLSKYKTREQAEEAGIKWIQKHLKKPLGYGSITPEKDFKLAKKAFEEFYQNYKLPKIEFEFSQMQFQGNAEQLSLF